jgi:hypothetical protein
MHCKRILLCAIAIAGCRNNFDPASYLTGLRVIAVKAEPPELGPGETATLTPLVLDSIDFDGGMKSWNADWWLCRETPTPGRSIGDDCVAHDAGTSLTPLGSGQTMAVTMPNVNPAELGIPDDTGGVYLPVVLHVSDGASEVDVVYRLRYSLLPFLKNHNPTIDDVQLIPAEDAGPPASLDQTIEVHLGDKIKLRTTMKPGSSEPYPLLEGALNLPDLGISVTDGGFTINAPISFFDGGVDVGGDKIELVNELLPVSWFTTVGGVSPDVTTAWQPELPDAKADLVETTLKLDSKHTPSAPADVDLWVVVRDGRGGTDWTHRQLLLR